MMTDKFRHYLFMGYISRKRRKSEKNSVWSNKRKQSKRERTRKTLDGHEEINRVKKEKREKLCMVE